MQMDEMGGRTLNPELFRLKLIKLKDPIGEAGGEEMEDQLMEDVQLLF